MLAALEPWRIPMGAQDGESGSKFAIGGIEIILSYDEGDPDFVDLISIEAPVRGTGLGTLALTHLCTAADMLGVKLTCYARAMDSLPASTARVVRWYERHGFTISCDNFQYWGEPDARDDDHTGCDMFREPRTPQSGQVT